MNTRLFIGIDVGKTGALTAFTEKEYYPLEIVRFDKMESFDVELPFKIRELCFGYDDVFVCLEKVGYKLGDGPKGAFSFGQTFGVIQGVLGTLQIPRKEVLPIKWKKKYNLIDGTISYSDKKKKAKEKVLQMFPNLSKYPIGVYDSILIADFCKKNWGTL